jgi:hypothetical protein
MTDEQILTEIQYRQQKIDDLLSLYNMPKKNINIWFNNGNELVSLTQISFPFNLSHELGILLLESIHFYETEISNLKNKL